MNDTEIGDEDVHQVQTRFHPVVFAQIIHMHTWVCALITLYCCHVDINWYLSLTKKLSNYVRSIDLTLLRIFSSVVFAIPFLYLFALYLYLLHQANFKDPKQNIWLSDEDENSDRLCNFVCTTTTTCVYLDRQFALPIWGATHGFLILFFYFIFVFLLAYS